MSSSERNREQKQNQKRTPFQTVEAVPSASLAQVYGAAILLMEEMKTMVHNLNLLTTAALELVNDEIAKR